MSFLNVLGLSQERCCWAEDGGGWKASTEGKLLVKLLEQSLKSFSQSVLGFLFVIFFLHFSSADEYVE